MSRSEEVFEKAKKRMPGGVNSPVRAFQAVGGHPRFMERADGPYIWDVDGNRYIDYIGSWGPMILGHNHPAIREAVIKAAEKGLSFGAATGIEEEVAELICDMVPSVEMLRMVNSGTEAVMSAVRVARGYTGRSKIIKFEGCYHGHSDSMLVKAGSGALTSGVPDSLGVPAGCAADGAAEICPAPLSPELTEKVQQTALAAHRCLGLSGYSRTDFRLTDDGELFVLEVNTLPGMTGASLVPKEAAAAGMEFGELLETLLSYAVEERS